MSLEERINRLEDRIAELLISQATLNDRYDDVLNRVAELEVTNEQLRQQMATLTAYLDLQPDQIDAEPDQFGMSSWLKQVVKRRIN